MHQPCRTAPTAPASPHPHPKGAGAETRRRRPISDPSTSTNEGAEATPNSPLRSPKKLHRKSRSATADQPGARALSNPFNFGIQKRTTPPAFIPPKSELADVDAPESKPERRRSFGSTFSFLQPWHGRDRLGSRSSTESTESGASTSGSEDGEAVKPGSGSGSELVPAARKQQQMPLQPSTTDHSTGLYFPSVRPGPPLASSNDPTTPADFGPSSPPALAQPGYHKAQMKKVLKHSRAELMKEVRKTGYNVLVVEGSVFSFVLYFRKGWY